MLRQVGLLLLLICVGYVFADHNCEIYSTYCNSGECHDGNTPTPTSKWAQPSCVCEAPYEGDQCHKTIRACRDNPCRNGGTCYAQSVEKDTVQLTADYFTCKCLPGFNGKLCEYMNPCLSNPCYNGGTCTDQSSGTQSSYSCDCYKNVTTQFVGSRCQYAMDLGYCDELNNDPNHRCQNGGNCTRKALAPFYNYTSCDCAHGYTGLYCENTACLSNPCMNGGTCYLGVCTCPSGVSGDFCQYNATTTLCRSKTCLNGGFCVYSTGNCQCPSDYTGTLCQFRTFCSSSPCMNGGTCNSFGTCTCPSTHNGLFCQWEKNFCASSPCQNGGTCVNGTGSGALSTRGYCMCNKTEISNSYWGYFCETKFVPSGCGVTGCGAGASCPCYNVDSCTNSGNNTVCVCPAADPANAGNFVADCRCNTTFAKRCVGGAGAAPMCLHGGTCLEHADDIYCSCPSGFYGKRCENYVNPCWRNPCKNGGYCTSVPLSAHSSGNIYPTRNHYTWRCTCKYPYFGNDCSLTALASACIPNPCSGNATCTQNAHPFSAIVNEYDYFPNGLPYTCHCLDSNREGTRCERTKKTTTTYVYATNCTYSNPCKNGGTCIIGASSSGNKACACPCGYTGKYCDYKATDGSMSNAGLGRRQDFCSPNPCSNGGTCVTTSNGRGFACVCPVGFTSTHATSFDADFDEREGFCTEKYWFNGASTVGAGMLVTVVSLVAGLFFARL